MAFANRQRSTLQGYYDSEDAASQLLLNETLVETNELDAIDMTQQLQVALKTIVFNYRDGLKAVRVPYAAIYELEHWFVEFYFGAWRQYNHDITRNNLNEDIMHKTRMANDTSYINHYENAISNLTLENQTKYDMDFSKQMARII